MNTQTTANLQTKENVAIVKSLKKISECKWVGNITHNNLDKCLRALNNNSCNSGWHNPIATRIGGLYGIYMINQDGSIFAEYRIIKVDNDTYRIECLTMEGWNQFENYYREFINE